MEEAGVNNCWVSNYTCLEQRGGLLRKEATGYGSVKTELAVHMGQRRLPWEEASPKAVFKWDASHGEGECKSPPCREHSCAVPARLGWQRRGPVCVCVCVSGRGRGAAEAHMPRFVRVREQHDHCHSGDFGFLSMHLNFKRKRTKTVRHFSTTHPLPLAATNLFSVYHWAWCLCTYVCVYVRLDSVSFSDWLISLPDNAGKVHPYCRKW